MPNSVIQSNIPTFAVFNMTCPVPQCTCFFSVKEEEACWLEDRDNVSMHTSGNVVVTECPDCHNKVDVPEPQQTNLRKLLEFRQIQKPARK